MHRFHFRNRELYCEEVPVAKIAKAVGTPFYLYSIQTFLDHYRRLRDAFKELKPLICFSVKSNSNLTVLHELHQAGSGLDIVSGGELFKALKVGTDPKRIVFASVGKTEEEIEAAIRGGILLFNVETEAELEVINRNARRLEKTQAVAIRINPDVEADTHHYIRTGTKESKFGLDLDTAYRIFMEAYRYPSLRFSGIHLHIGSQITDSKPFVQALKKAAEFVGKIRRNGVPLEYLNIGGGLGIIYSNEKPQTADQFAKAVLPILRPLGLRLILEPGRFISGNSGILVTKVIYWKTSKTKQFLIVDAGMNDLLRPSIYGAHHEIVPVDQRPVSGKPVPNVDVVGPICESGDFLGKGRSLPRLHPGDLVAVMSAGAYGFTMSSNYNSRPRVSEVAVNGKHFAVARARETYEDLIRLEKIVKWPKALRRK